jgi:hypothetical protein
MFFRASGLVLQRDPHTARHRADGRPSEGNIFAGEFFAPDVLLLPGPGWSQYPRRSTATTSAVRHPPGGCVMGAPGSRRGPDHQDLAKSGLTDG